MSTHLDYVLKLHYKCYQTNSVTTREIKESKNTQNNKKIDILLYTEITNGEDFICCRLSLHPKYPIFALEEAEKNHTKLFSQKCL